MSESASSSAAKMYEEYLVPGVHARWAPVLLRHADPQPGEAVLDVACGTGIVARLVAPVVDADQTVVAVDANPDMLAVGRGAPAPAGADIDWRLGDVTDLPDGPFDLVTCQQGLQFFPDRGAALAEMRRVLRPGGRVALNVFGPLHEQALYAVLFEATARHVGQPVEAVATPCALGDPDAVHDLVVAAGFADVTVQTESVQVEFPDPDRFVTMTVTAAAAVVPEMGSDPDARAEVIGAVRHDVEDVLPRYIDGDRVSFAMRSNIVVGRS